MGKLFGDDEPELIEKMYKWRAKKVDDLNPLLRYCTKPNCEGTMIAKNRNVKYV